jgi:hypothetical protein
MLQKQSVPINFSQGLDLKTDPKQVSVGKFLSLQNSIFDKGGLLQKRNGFGQLETLPDNTYAYVTTLNDNLTAIGPTIAALSIGSETWIPKGSIYPMQVSVLPLIRNNANQTQCDAAVSPNGFVCTVYSETVDGTTFTHKYAVADSTTGQNIVEPTLLPGSDPTYGTPRVFLFYNYFVIIFTTHPSSYHLSFIAISYNNPSIVTTPQDITVSYTPSTTVSWDAVVYGNTMYIAYNSASGGQSAHVVSLSYFLTLTGFSHSFTGSIATMMSMSVDGTNPSVPIIYMSWYDLASMTGYTAAVNSNCGLVLAPTEIISATSVGNITCYAKNGSCQSYYEVLATPASNSNNYVSSVPCSQPGVVGSTYIVVRSVGLGSKAFSVAGTVYFLGAYQTQYQPSYFLINASISVQAAPIVAGKIAYENGGGYLTTGLPGVSVIEDVAQIAYLYKDLITALATEQNSQQTTTGGVYSQTGINLGTFTINNLGIDTAEIASTLNISGGFLWMYDGYLPVEQNFFLWPDSVVLVSSTTGGSMAAQTYYYQAVYSWTDNAGNIHRSAPSIPVSVTTSGSTSSVIVIIPTLRLTYKIANPIKIEVYRWSTANQIYYQVSASTTNPNPMEAPLYNNTTVDFEDFTDTWPDSAIIGNNIIYTNGGVVEDVNAPASNLLTLFDDRLWLVDAEDPNLLWFSKQVIEGTPVEMSDLFTFYVAPTAGAQGSTGVITSIAPMDDKLIIFKGNAIYYINGTGPDNTGANNQYSQPIFVTSTVGCINQNSIVFTPQGLMFQSDKGIWTLGRDLQTSYTGAPVQDLTLGAMVESAVNVPETNQVRFTLNTGETLMYDYYYSQWGEFVGIPAISSTIYEGLHTFINQYGEAYQESPGVYLDGRNPVLMQFTTSWLNLAGLQGYQRAYFFYILGQYLTPHKLQVSIAYDYNSSPSQSSLISPSNFNSSVPSPFGVPSAPFGANSDLEQWRVFLTKQRCQAFQISIQEVYDASFGIPAGAGLTISGLNVIVGLKSKFRTISSSNSIGGYVR